MPSKCSMVHICTLKKKFLQVSLTCAWRHVLAGEHKKIDWEIPPGSKCLGPPNQPPQNRGTTKPLFLARFCSAWVYVQMATVGVALLEKQKKYREANEKLLCLLGGNCCPSRRGYWWNRLTTNLEKHLHRVQEALEVLLATLQCFTQDFPLSYHRNLSYCKAS